MTICNWVTSVFQVLVCSWVVITNNTTYTINKVSKECFTWMENRLGLFPEESWTNMFKTMWFNGKLNAGTISWQTRVRLPSLYSQQRLWLSIRLLDWACERRFLSTSLLQARWYSTITKSGKLILTSRLWEVVRSHCPWFCRSLFFFFTSESR